MTTREILTNMIQVGIAIGMGEELDHDKEWHLERAERQLREILIEGSKDNLVLFGGELAYCLANKVPIGEGYTPPSIVYENMETTVNDWLKSRQIKEYSGIEESNE